MLLNLLESEGIKYTPVYQQAGQAVITLEGVYHYGFSEGDNIAEARNYTDSVTSVSYRYCHGSCGSQEKIHLYERDFELLDEVPDNIYDSSEESIQAPKRQRQKAVNPQTLPNPRRYGLRQKISLG